MDNIIVEKLCVNDNVIQMGREIMNEVEKRLKSTKCYISNERRKIIKKGSFVYNTNGKLQIESFNVQYIVYLYDNEKEYLTDYNNVDINIDCECIYEDNLIILKLAEVNGVLTKECIGTIEHELNHMLQGSFGQKQNETLYEKVLYQIENSFGLYQDVAYALYMSFNTEIASFTTQYYTFLKNKNVPLYDIRYSFPNDENNPYNTFLWKYNCVMSHQSAIFDDEVKKRFGITKHDMLKRLENANKRYKTKIMKAIMKYRDELNEKYERDKIRNRGKNHFIEIHQFASFRRHNFLLECYNKGIHEEASEYE